jgi:hypothetical protein
MTLRPLHRLLALPSIALVGAIVACNALVGTPEAVLREAPPDAAADASPASHLDAAAEDAPSCSSDLATDPASCGACGHSCLHGACVGGACQPFLIAESGGAPTRIVAEPGSSGQVFWADFWTGQIFAYAKSTGAIRLLHDGIDAAAGDTATGLIAQDGRVYWTSAYDSSIRWIDGDGKNAGSIQGDWNYPLYLAIDPDWLYWSDRYGHDVWRLSLHSHVPSLLHPASDAGADYLWIAADPGAGGYVFFSDESHVYRMNKDGTGFDTLDNASIPGSSPNTGPIGVDSGYVYWLYGANRDLVRVKEPYGCPGVGACPQVIVKGSLINSLTGIAFDGTYAYWADNGAGRVARAKKDGSSLTPDVIAELQKSVAGIAVDDVAIYWTVQFDNGSANRGSVWAVAK